MNQISSTLFINSWQDNIFHSKTGATERVHLGIVFYLLLLLFNKLI
jgi:hypothetical protein